MASSPSDCASCWRGAQNSAYNLVKILKNPFPRNRDGFFNYLKFIVKSTTIYNYMIKRLLHSKTKTIASAAFLLAISSLLSRFLGFIRDRLLMEKFGAGQVSDIYFAAFRIPDFIYNILIVGAIAVAFIPVFSEYFKSEHDELKDQWPEEAARFTNNLLNCFLLLLVSLCVVLAIFTPVIIKFIVPGFSSADKATTINLTRIMFLSPILFGLSSIFSGILQYFNRFFVYSLAPLLYNFGIIIGILFLVPLFGIYGLGYGVILGALMYFLIQIPTVKIIGFRYKFVLDFKHAGIKKVFKMMGPRIIGVTADNINLVIMTAIASTLAIGSISIFNLSNNFQYLPVGIIGISFAVSSFPVFSKFMANGQKAEFFENFSSIFRQIVFLITPMSILIFILRAQIVRLLYGAGNFSWTDTRLTAASLGLFCLGILVNSLQPLVARAFFSFHDTKTPVISGLVSVTLNIFFSLLFVFLLNTNAALNNFFINFLKLDGVNNIEVIALPLAYSLASIFELILSILLLYKKIGDFGIKKILSSFLRILASSVFASAVSYFTLYFVSLIVDMQTFIGVFWQAFFGALAGILVYFMTAHFLKFSEFQATTAIITRKFKDIVKTVNGFAK